MTDQLHLRAQKIRERALVLAWQYRQRHHSQGTWWRLRRALVDAAEAWEIGDDDAGRLAEEGFEPLAVGREFAPPKRFFVATSEQLEALGSRRRLAVRLNADLLGARNVVLVPFRL